VILKERVCPRRTPAIFVFCIRRRRESSPVDRGASRCICNHHPITKELRYQMDVGYFAATQTAWRILEVRLSDIWFSHKREFVNEDRGVTGNTSAFKTFRTCRHCSAHRHQ